MYYNRQGQPISSTEWASTLETDRRLAYHISRNSHYEVSTVWLGLDHNYGGMGPPLIFETMVFLAGEEKECIRYATEEQALIGHRNMMTKYDAFDLHPSDQPGRDKRNAPPRPPKTGRFARLDIE